MDDNLVAVRDCLEQFCLEHPDTTVELYRHNPMSIRVRIVNAAYRDIDVTERHGAAWQYLADRLPVDALEEISILLTLTPEEVSREIGSLDFDDPVPEVTIGR
jgi:hypothetical protein